MSTPRARPDDHEPGRCRSRAVEYHHLPCGDARDEKKLGVRNRCRVFEIPEGIDYIMAKPHMRDYMKTSADVYSVYLRYIAPEDMHVYSIDECFIDATPYPLPLR